MSSGAAVRPEATGDTQLARARESGNDKGVAEAEEALAARRSWLTEAERTLAELSG